MASERGQRRTLQIHLILPNQRGAGLSNLAESGRALDADMWDVEWDIRPGL